MPELPSYFNTHTLRLDDALDSYNQIRQSLAETQVILPQRPEDQLILGQGRDPVRLLEQVGPGRFRVDQGNHLRGR